MFGAPRGQCCGDLAGGVRVQVGAVARVIGGGVLADHERPVAGHRQQGFPQDLVGDDIATQTTQCLANIREILREAGCTLDQVVKSTVWLVNREDFGPFNAIYASHFPSQPPVRSTVVCGLVLPGALVEIEVIAYAP